MRSATGTRGLKQFCPLTYILYEQRVPRDPLHGLEQEAGERHAFAVVVGGDLLLEGEEHSAK